MNIIKTDRRRYYNRKYLWCPICGSKVKIDQTDVQTNVDTMQCGEEVKYIKTGPTSISWCIKCQKCYQWCIVHASN